MLFSGSLLCMENACGMWRDGLLGHSPLPTIPAFHAHCLILLNEDSPPLPSMGLGNAQCVWSLDYRQCRSFATHATSLHRAALLSGVPHTSPCATSSPCAVSVLNCMKQKGLVECSFEYKQVEPTGKENTRCVASCALHWSLQASEA